MQKTKQSANAKNQLQSGQLSAERTHKANPSQQGCWSSGMKTDDESGAQPPEDSSEINLPHAGASHASAEHGLVLPCGENPTWLCERLLQKLSMDRVCGHAKLHCDAPWQDSIPVSTMEAGDDVDVAPACAAQRSIRCHRN